MELRDQLEEEKKKVEDLQFRLEEAEILKTEGSQGSQEVEDNMKALRAKIIELEENSLKLKADHDFVEKKVLEEKGKSEKLEIVVASFSNVEKEKEAIVNKVAMLTKELAQAEKRCENFETEANKVFEAEEQLMIVNEDLSLVKKKLEESETQLARERSMKEELMSSQKNQDTTTSEKMIRFENESRSKDTQILELTHDVERMKVSSQEHQEKYCIAVTEMNGLKKVQQDLLAKSERQEAELSEKLAEITSITSKGDQFKEEIEQLKNTMDTENLRVKEIEHQLVIKDKEVNAVKAQLDQTGSETQNELKLKIEEVSHLSTEVSSKEAEKDKLNKELTIKEEQIQQITSELTISEKNIVTLTELKGSMTKEIEALKETSASTTSEVTRLVEAASKKDFEIANQGKNIKSLNSQTEELLEKLKISEKDHQEHAEKIRKECDENLLGFNKSQNQLHKELETLKKELIDTKNKSESKEKEISDTMEASVSRLNKSVGIKEATIVELEDKIRSLREDSVTKNSSSESIMTELKSKEEELKASKEAQSKLRDDHSQLKLEKNAVEQDLQTKTFVCESQLKELKALVESSNKLQKCSTELEDKNKALDENMNLLSTQVKDLMSQSSVSGGSLEKAISENKELSIELAALNKTKIEISQKLQTTEEGLAKLHSDMETSNKQLEYNKGLADAKERELSALHESTVSKLSESIKEKDSALEDMEEKISKLREESMSKDSSSQSILCELKLKEEEIKSLKDVKEQEHKSLEKIIEEKQKEVDSLHSQTDALESQTKELQEVASKFNNLTVEATQLQETVNKLLEEKQKLNNELTGQVTQTTQNMEQLEQIRIEKETIVLELDESVKSGKDVQRKLQEMELALEETKTTFERDLEDLNKNHLTETTKLSEKLQLAQQEGSETTKEKEDVIVQLNSALDATRKSVIELKTEKEKLQISKESEAAKLSQEVSKLEDLVTEKDEKLEASQWRRADLEKQLEKLKHEHEEEMGEMVDVVNDLKMKEDELCLVEKDLKSKTNKIDELCKQLLQQEQSHKDQIKKKEAQLDDDLKSSCMKTEEAKNQCGFLKEQMAAVKVENDLQVQKVKMEFEVEMNSIKGQLDQKATLLNKAKEDLGNKEEELEFIKEELQAKKEEIEELSSDLDIKEASFSNESKDVEERHQEEVEELITKNEALGENIGKLKETIAKQTSEFDSKIDDITKTKKAEVNSVKDQLSEKEIQVMDLEANVKTLEEKIHHIECNLEGEATLATTKIEKISSENEALRRSKYELENIVKNTSAEREHIVVLNEELSVRIVEFEVQVKEMRSQYESLQVSVIYCPRKAASFCRWSTRSRSCGLGPVLRGLHRRAEP